MKLLSSNKKAKFNYELIDKYVAGISLMGSEVKSIKMGSANIENSYIQIREGSAYLKQMNVPKYEFQNMEPHQPERERRLLLNKKEIKKLDQEVKTKNLTLIPTAMLVGNRGLIKIEFFTAKSKNKADKREQEKKKEFERIKKMY